VRSARAPQNSVIAAEEAGVFGLCCSLIRFRHFCMGSTMAKKAAKDAKYARGLGIVAR
jgi:hypothetical protein